MTYQVDEREARKAYVRRRQTIVFSISGAVLAVVLVIALLFNFHVFGLGEVETPARQPNYGNAAPCGQGQQRQSAIRVQRFGRHSRDERHLSRPIRQGRG